jgi:penicillin-insensitive murein endopeptidase
MRAIAAAGLAIVLSSVALASSPPLPQPRPALPTAAPAPAPEKPAKETGPGPNEVAKTLFGQMREAAPMRARAIGFYSKGCLAGAVALPVDGENWQAMRLSRNRNWGHPELIAMLERLAAKAPKVAGWHGILVGDLAQPRGGPMVTGHASHQLGLDADVWLTPMPDRRLSREERESISASMMVRKDRLDIDPANWTPGHMHVIKAAAEDPKVERVLVNAAIKKALCREAGSDRAWLAKVRPYWGHDYHMHIRIGCPPGSPDCQGQDPVPGGDGCGAELEQWFKPAIVSPPPPKDPPKPKPPLTMADLPPACREVLIAR